MKRNETILLLLRYTALILLGISNLYVFYLIFTPLTVYPSFWLLNILYDAVLYPGNVIFFKGYFASIIPACVAGAAYYLLLILNLTTPMKVGKRMLSLLFLFGSFLVLNVFRILIFAAWLTQGYQYFDLTHTATWYFGSTIMVVLIWFANVLIFRLRKIPVYSDFSDIIKDIKR